MKKIIPLTCNSIFTVIIVLSGFTSNAQNIDSLLKLAQDANEDRRIEIYIELANTTRTSAIDTSLFFSQMAFDNAITGKNNTLKIKAHNTLARTLSIKGNYQLALKYYEQGLQLGQQEKKDSLIAASFNGMGNCYWQLGKHDQSLEKHFESLRIREKIADIKGIGASKVNIGMVYQSQQKLQLAEKYVQEALVILSQQTDPTLQLNALHTLANIYGEQGKIQQALELDAKGIDISQRTNNEFSKSLFYDNMGNCFLYGDPPDYIKALEYFRKTLEIDSSFDNKKQMSDSYANLGTVYLSQQKFTEAIPYLQRSVLLAGESGYIQGKVKALQLLSSAYQKAGNAEAAYTTLQQSMKVKDSVVNSSSEARIAEMQTLYETEKKEQQISLQRAQLSKKNYIIAGTIVLAILLGLLGISAYMRFRLKQKTKLQAEILKQQEIATKAVIEAEENERQRIARDLHDGIGQMMSAAKMNLSAFESDLQLKDPEQQQSFDKIIGLVDESCKELRSVSHNMMPNALLKNSLASAIRDFIDKMDKKSLQVHLYTEGLDERLDANVETVLYRVIQECVNNVIKHAGANTLDISVIRDKDGISATIEDNGKGFDSNNNANFEGIGLKNIITRVEYLKGTVEFDSTIGKGTLVALNVPLEPVI